jgi:hypothetical protein
MSALKEYIKNNEGHGDGFWHPSFWKVLVEISDRLDEDHKRLVDNSKRLDRLEQQAHSHAPSVTIAGEVVPESTIYTQDERSCQNCVNKCPVNIGPNYRCSQCQPKAQEQGGEDKPIQGCYYDHDDCEAVRDLRARLDDEKKRRVYYQGIVYDVMNSMSNGKMVCGTVDEPSTQVQDGVRLVLKHRNEFEQEAMNLRARLAKYEGKEHGGDVSAIYQTDEYGNQTRVYSQSDIDELRARLSVAESNVAKMTNALATGNKITIVTEEYAAVVARLALLEKENAELRDWNKFAKESVAVASADVSKLQTEKAELKRQKEAWRDEFIILNDVMRDVSACNAYDDDEISRIDKSEVKV